MPGRPLGPQGGPRGPRPLPRGPRPLIFFEYPLFFVEYLWPKVTEKLSLRSAHHIRESCYQMADVILAEGSFQIRDFANMIVFLDSLKS